MSGRVVHFEIPFDDAERAHAFYREIFGWQLAPVPGMSYTLASTGPTGDQGASEPQVGPPDVARLNLAGLDVVCPPGTPEIDGVHMQLGDEPSAVALCRLVLRRLATGAATDRPVPLYLRRPDVMAASAPKSVLP